VRRSARGDLLRWNYRHGADEKLAHIVLGVATSLPADDLGIVVTEVSEQITTRPC
jgi:hypothetical protein